MAIQNISTPQNFSVRGIQYEGREKWARKARAGDTVSLLPEPENPYDSYAVKVVTSRGRHQLGYVPREISRQVFELIQMPGCSFSAVISKKYNSGGRPVLVVQVAYTGLPDVQDPVLDEPDGVSHDHSGIAIFAVATFLMVLFLAAGPVMSIFLIVMGICGYRGWKKESRRNE